MGLPRSKKLSKSRSDPTNHKSNYEGWNNYRYVLKDKLNLRLSNYCRFCWDCPPLKDKLTTFQHAVRPTSSLRAFEHKKKKKKKKVKRWWDLCIRACRIFLQRGKAPKYHLLLFLPLEALMMWGRPGPLLPPSPRT